MVPSQMLLGWWCGGSAIVNSPLFLPNRYHAMLAWPRYLHCSISNVCHMLTGSVCHATTRAPWQVCELVGGTAQELLASGKLKPEQLYAAR